MSEKDLALEYAVANDTASNRFTIRLDSGPIRTDSRPQKRGPSGWSGLREHQMHHESSSNLHSSFHRLARCIGDGWSTPSGVHCGRQFLIGALAPEILISPRKRNPC